MGKMGSTVLPAAMRVALSGALDWLTSSAHRGRAETLKQPLGCC
jgi:hypothetical protein